MAVHDSFTVLTYQINTGQNDRSLEVRYLMRSIKVVKIKQDLRKGRSQ